MIDTVRSRDGHPRRWFRLVDVVRGHQGAHDRLPRRRLEAVHHDHRQLRPRFRESTLRCTRLLLLSNKCPGHWPPPLGTCVRGLRPSHRLRHHLYSVHGFQRRSLRLEDAQRDARHALLRWHFRLQLHDQLWVRRAVDWQHCALLWVVTVHLSLGCANLRSGVIADLFTAKDRGMAMGV